MALEKLISSACSWCQTSKTPCLREWMVETLSFHDYCSFHKGPVLQTTVTSSNRIHVGRHPSPCFAAPQCPRVKANSTSPSSCSPLSSFQYLWGFVPEPSLGFLCGGRCRFFRVLYCLKGTTSADVPDFSSPARILGGAQICRARA